MRAGGCLNAFSCRYVLALPSARVEFTCAVSLSVDSNSPSSVLEYECSGTDDSPSPHPPSPTTHMHAVQCSAVPWLTTND